MADNAGYRREDEAPSLPAEPVMPQDTAAEASVLSAMLLSPDVLQDALVELSPDDFYVPSNRTIFLAMRDLFDRSQPVDPISLADYLKSEGELAKVGGSTY